MGNEQPAPVANVVENPEATRADAVQADAVPADGDETADDAVGAQDTSKTAALPTATPSVKAVPHGPVENDGHKMYSLAGIVRHPSVPSHMPPREAPDTRLKNYGKMTASATPPTPDAAASLLGLQKPAAAIAATPTLDDAELPETRLPDPGFSAPLNMGNDARTPSGNAIPAQLIQDMMLLNMQKYQNDLKSGTLRGSSLDVNG
jgi:hypothetical protein